MEKPKRKRELHSSSPFLKLLNVAPIEFVSPLPVEECARRLREKGRWGHMSPTRLEVTLVQRGPDTYDFHLKREIGERSYLRREKPLPVRVTGRLSFWDDGETLVSCRAHASMFMVLAPIFIVPSIMCISLLVTMRSRSGLYGAAFLIALAVGMCIYLLFKHITSVTEHHKLVGLIEDMLRDPIVF